MVALAGVDGEYGEVDGCRRDGGTVTETKGFAPSDTITEGAACVGCLFEFVDSWSVVFVVALNIWTHARLDCMLVVLSVGVGFG